MSGEEAGGFGKAGKTSVRKSGRRSEFDFIERVRRQQLERLSKRSAYSSLITHYSSLIRGIGDDAAIVRPRRGHDAVITADLLVEEIDFRRDSMPPRFLGHKALAVSLSDIAAMGARPRWALLSVGVPREIWRSRFLEEFYAGFYELADEHGVALIGGDVSRAPERLIIDSIALGEVARGRAVLRSGAQVGDQIFVTGALGGAAAGLRLLESSARLARGAARSYATPPHKLSARAALVLRHLRPAPRVEWGALLGEKRLASAMIDLSDGLSSDLAHICAASGVGAEVDAALLPLDPNLARVRGQGWDALALALHGGEDFELLFTINPRRAARLPEEIEGVRATRVGEITDQAGDVRLRQGGRARRLRPAGFVHFAGAGRGETA